MVAVKVKATTRLNGECLCKTHGKHPDPRQVELRVKTTTYILDGGFKVLNHVKEIVESHGGSPNEQACTQIERYFSSLPESSKLSDENNLTQWALLYLFRCLLGSKNWLEVDTKVIDTKQIKYSLLPWAVMRDLDYLMEDIQVETSNLEAAENETMANLRALLHAEWDWVEENNERPTVERNERDGGMKLLAELLRKWAMSYGEEMEKPSEEGAYQEEKCVKEEDSDYQEGSGKDSIEKEPFEESSVKEEAIKKGSIKKGYTKKEPIKKEPVKKETIKKESIKKERAKKEPTKASIKQEIK
ncbi:hypothetical protein PTT_00716 [Pyrenophora teres f. teres 0-1]|uniref:Uncharacterized protein n=1 Tax=Pyrenophora teres f. teres (strain 0-1) TaxID=861557 RepID=E3RCN2_PYRTT|nr:hypothetical protein PTT_00716 [Pyrenophora teres f. teres 0-1]